MAKKTLVSGLSNIGVAPNILIQHVENTVPFLFEGELNLEGSQRKYLNKLVFYKKNLKALQKINLAEYFSFCMSAHWATAGTYVPTNVDNQIREDLWRHETIGAFIQIMAKTTMDAWTWDYNEVTNRKAFIPNGQQNCGTEVLSTHEGTWLSVAIGAYCALMKNQRPALAHEMADYILKEIAKEEVILTQLFEQKDYINYMRGCALMAHNFGDLDRVMDQWHMDENDSFYQRIYKLGHRPNTNYSGIFVLSGEINKQLLSLENHRHMSLRAPRCLRRSKEFLVPVGPFMDDWGKLLAATNKISLEEKAEIVIALLDGHQRQDLALGYVRAFKNIIAGLPDGLMTLDRYIPVDSMKNLKNSKLFQLATVDRQEFEADYIKRMQEIILQKAYRP